MSTGYAQKSQSLSLSPNLWDSPLDSLQAGRLLIRVGERRESVSELVARNLDM